MGISLTDYKNKNIDMHFIENTDETYHLVVYHNFKSLGITLKHERYGEDSYCYFEDCYADFFEMIEFANIIKNKTDILKNLVPIEYRLVL